MRILGIDPGSTATGFGVIDRVEGELRHVAHGTVRLPRGAPLSTRLSHLQEVLSEVIDLHRPDVAVVEQVFVSVSPRSALVLGQARGAALAALGRAGLAVVEYAASSIKQSVAGNGRASKAQVQRMVRRSLSLDRTPATDAADALAAAISHAYAGRLVAVGAVGTRRRRSRRSLSTRFQGRAR